jgi:hypothetical protein
MEFTEMVFNYQRLYCNFTDVSEVCQASNLTIIKSCI